MRTDEQSYFDEQSHFPVLDSDRADSTVLATDGITEPYVEEMDYWTALALPVRVVLTQGAGSCIEIGPHTFDSRDVAVPRRAIVGYDRATGTEKDQR